MVAITVLQVSPPKRRSLERTAAPCRVERRFPIRSTQPSGSHHHGLAGLFHHQAPEVGGNIVLDLPASLIHGASIPILLCIETVTEIAQVSLQSIEIQLKVFKTVISNLGHHRQNDESKLTLFSQSKIGRPLSTNSTLDIGKAFNLQLDSTIIPTFSHPRLEVSYNLQVRLLIECGGQIFKEDFLAKDVQIVSNRTPNSPLRRDHLCTFLSENRQIDSAPPVYSSIEGKRGPDISSAYLCLSRLLTLNFIPHNPVPSWTGERTIILHGQPQLLDSPQLPSQQTSINPFSMNGREDALRDDQYLLDRILNEGHGYKTTTMRTGRAAVERFAYSWCPSTTSLKSRIRGVSTNLEISVFDAQSPPSSEVPPPPYWKATDPFSPITLLNRTLHLIADFQHPDASLVSDVECVVNEFGGELRSRLGEVDVRAAKEAVAKFKILRWPLMGLGVAVDPGSTWSEEKGNGKDPSIGANITTKSGYE